ncbi:hypothetical protein ABZ840_37615, partial [Streptomyces sp. NPDC047117]|uniref:hypothetical protein n=1 Tax=Streptomyces sp. NPDC047117 TaxID=3155379 RepID=UPI0033D0FCFF
MDPISEPVGSRPLSTGRGRVFDSTHDRSTATPPLAERPADRILTSDDYRAAPQAGASPPLSTAAAAEYFGLPSVLEDRRGLRLAEDHPVVKQTTG